MDILKISEAIQQKIGLLEIGRGELKTRAEAKANGIVNYDKALAKTIMRLRNGEKITLDGVTTENPPVSILEKIAKGLCWKERLEMDKADLSYKNALVKLEAIQAELNGYQSINRYLDNT